MQSSILNSAQILHIADAVARDKNINREAVIEAMEQAIQRAGRSKYGQEHDIRVHIDRRNGEIKLQRYREVVATRDDVEDDAQQIPLEQAKQYQADADVGDYLIDTLPPVDFGRIAAQAAKQVILQKVREAEREKQYDEFKDRVGEIINGIVKRVEFGSVTVDMGHAEGYIRRHELIQREVFRQGDRIRAYVYDVRKDAKGPQILLSRTHPQFMAKLFAQEVPEVYEGIIEIRAVARDPGSRAKIIVYTSDGSIDPVGSCVGMRGSRVQAVVSELQGEKVDIIPWSDDLATLVVRALTPADVVKVVLDEENNKIIAIVPDDQLSLAIGRRGQNVRLAANLLGLDIDIMTEADEAEKRSEEFRQRSEFFSKALDIDDVIAHLLVMEGFTSIEEIAYVPLEELLEIEGFDENVAAELINRAQGYLEQQAAQYAAKRTELGFEESLVTEAGLTEALAIKVAENGVKTLDDLADLDIDELRQFTEQVLSEEEASTVIMAARQHWFADDAGDASAAS